MFEIWTELVTDGLTTCDLCAWAWNEKSSHPLEGHNETGKLSHFMHIHASVMEFEFDRSATRHSMGSAADRYDAKVYERAFHLNVFISTPTVVSFCSAILGAFCMITALKYRR